MAVDYLVLDAGMLEELARVINESGRDQPQFAPVSAAQLRVGLMDDPDYDPEGALVAFEGGRAIASAIASWSKAGASAPGGQQCVLQVAAVPDRRGAGVEIEIMCRLLAHCRSAGLGEALLSVNVGSAWKIELARELGFSPSRRNYRLAKPLSAAIPATDPITGFSFEIVDIKDAGDGFIEEFLASTNASFSGYSNFAPITAEQTAMMKRLPGIEAACILARAEGGKPAGVCLAMIDRQGAPQSGDINVVGVVPAFRRRGIARGLLLRAFAWLAGRGVVEVTLSTEAQNTGALSLYTALGFEVRTEAIAFRVKL